MPVVEARQRAVTSAPRRRPGTPAKMSDQTIQRLKTLLDQSPSSFHAQAFVALVRAEIMRLLPANPQGFDINIRGRLDKANSNYTLQVQYNPHANDWNAIVNNLTRWLRQQTSNRKACVRMDRIRMSPTNDRFWVQVYLPLQESSMATARKKTRADSALMGKVTDGTSGARKAIVSSLGKPKTVITSSAALNNAAKQVMQAFKLEAAKPEENGSTSLRVTLNINDLSISKRQLPELLAVANTEVKAQTDSLAERTLREEHTSGSDMVTFIADISTGFHTMQDIDPDRFQPPRTTLR